MISLASPLLVFIATVLGFYFTARRDGRKGKLDEVKFIVAEIKDQKQEALEEIERIKTELRKAEIRERQCQEQLRYWERIVHINRSDPYDR